MFNGKKSNNMSIKGFFAVKTVNNTVKSNASTTNKSTVGLVRAPLKQPLTTTATPSWMSQSAKAFEEDAFDDLDFDAAFNDLADEEFNNDSQGSNITQALKTSSMISALPAPAVQYARPAPSSSAPIPTPVSVPVPTLPPGRKRVLPWDVNTERDTTRVKRINPTITGNAMAQSLDTMARAAGGAQIPRQPQPKQQPANGSSVARPTTSPDQPPPIVLSEEQKGVLELVMQGKSLFFTGAAGTGKSVLLREIIKQLKKKYPAEFMGVTASTGLAALNIGGETLHRFSGIGLGQLSADVLAKNILRRQEVSNRWKRCKVLIIDEISMVDGVLLDKLDFIARHVRQRTPPFGGIQLICTGDFFQLPPVDNGARFNQKKEKTIFAFESKVWALLLKTAVVMTQVFRQQGDNNLIEMLNSMRMGLLTPDLCKSLSALSRPVKYADGIEPTELYPTRREVEFANKRRLEALRGMYHVYDAGDAFMHAALNNMGLSHDDGVKLLDTTLAQKSLLLRHDCQVMVIRNLNDAGLVNGMLGRVIAFLTGEEFQSVASWESTDIETVCRTIEANRDANGVNQPETLSSVGTIRHSCGDFSAVLKTPSSGSDTNAHDPASSHMVFPVVLFAGCATAHLMGAETFEIVNRESVTMVQRQQIPLILSWAMSVHKSQGQTLDRVVVNLQRTFESGQAYVAVSRAVTAERLQIINFAPSKVKASPKVIEFYKNLAEVWDLKVKRKMKRQQKLLQQQQPDNKSSRPASRSASRSSSRTASSGVVDFTGDTDDEFSVC